MKLVTKGHLGNEVVGEIPILIGTVPVRQPLATNASKFEGELVPPAPSAPPAGMSGSKPGVALRGPDDKDLAKLCLLLTVKPV